MQNPVTNPQLIRHDLLHAVGGTSTGHEGNEGPPGRGYLLVAGIDPIQISPDGINPECHRLFFENSGEAPVDEGVGSFDCMSFNNGAGGANQCLL